MKTLSKDARGFIEGVARFVRSDTNAKSAVPKVESLLTKVSAAAKKEENADVFSSVLLVSAEKSRIEKLLANLLGHTVICHYSVDSTILGGIKIQVADWIVDSSLSTQLADIARSLLTV